jgi:hypothetical protein
MAMAAPLRPSRYPGANHLYLYYHFFLFLGLFHLVALPSHVDYNNVLAWRPLSFIRLI